jgi:hypothetical protein
VNKSFWLLGEIIFPMTFLRVLYVRSKGLWKFAVQEHRWIGVVVRQLVCGKKAFHGVFVLQPFVLLEYTLPQ